MSNYVQPDFRLPVISGVTVQVESKNNNPMKLTWPMAIYSQPIGVKDDPQGTIASGKSGKGGPG